MSGYCNDCGNTLCLCEDIKADNQRINKMAKTKEIEVFIPSIELDSFARAEILIGRTRDMRIGGDWHKAKLIIELPERKAEITESEFDEVIAKHFTQHWIADEMVKIKQKLFGNASE